MTPPLPPTLELRHVSHGAEVRGISAAFPAGCFHVLRGEAHSGKDALLRLLGLLEPPERGEVWLRGVPTRALDDPARTALRNRECGYVFAAPFLLAGFSVIENVAMPLFKISQVGPEAARRRTIAVLDFVGLAGAMEAPAAELPPAAQRSVALARALVNEPAVLLIEELETGADAAEFAALLRRACEHYGVAVIATASPAFSAHDDDRVIDLAGGRVRRDSEIVRQP